jgi:hypothetical protein
LAETQILLRAHAEAAQTAEELRRVPPDHWGDCFNAACYLARCMALAKEDPKLSADKRKELTEAYSNRAMQLFREAVQLFREAIRKGSRI